MKHSNTTCSSSSPNLKPFSKKYICINFLIDIIQDRIKLLHQDGELFNEKHNNLFISHIKLLALLQKMQQAEAKAKDKLESSIYQEIVGILNGKK